MVVSDLKIALRTCADLAVTLVIHDLSDSSTSKNIFLHLCMASTYIFSPRSAALKNQQSIKFFHFQNNRNPGFSGFHIFKDSE